MRDDAGGRPAVGGIITDRDIVRARLEHASALSALNVADVMTRTPLVLDAQDSLPNAIRHRRARGVRRASVVGRDGALREVVSRDDLLGAIAAEVIGLAHRVARRGRSRQA